MQKTLSFKIAFCESSPNNKFVKAIYLKVNVKAIVASQITFIFEDIVTYIYRESVFLPCIIR
jgi:hypothetical protein